jgi:hypothetical protein
VTAPLRTLLERLVSQEVARTNAAQASVRLIHERRQLEDVEAFLSEQARDRPHGPRTSADVPSVPEIGRRRGR